VLPSPSPAAIGLFVIPFVLFRIARKIAASAVSAPSYDAILVMVL
jgi:hypothetical protein